MIIFSTLLGLGTAQGYWNSVYQFGIEIPKPDNDPFVTGKTMAFLWVPPAVKRIRAIILAPANIIERRFCDDSIIRAEAARDGIALLYFQSGLAKGAVDNPRLISYLQDILDKMACKSGYAEISTVPWIPVGHSGNSQFCQGIARLRPDKILANIIFKGALPGINKNGSTDGLAGIPIIFFTGEFEEVMPPGKVRNAWWGVQMQRFYTVKGTVPQALINGMEDRSRGHISWTADMSAYAALFIHKAMLYRLNKTKNGQLSTVEFASGWLADPSDSVESAPVNKYKGNPRRAFWFFDEEQCRVWKPMFERDKGKKEQLLAFMQADTIAQWWKGWGVQEIEFKPMADGASFKVKTDFRAEVPQPFADAGKKLGHSNKDAISYAVAGWASATEQTGPDVFRFRFDREGVNGRTTHVVICASHPGDNEYRETVAAVHFFVPGNNAGGIKQVLTFPKINNVKKDEKMIPLKGNLSSELKPDYYVSWGPAEIVNNNEIRLTNIPVNAKFPIEVKVTAYQYGSSNVPQYATSNFVTQTFLIEK